MTVKKRFTTASAVNLPISHYFFFLYSFYLLFVEKAARETGRSFLLLPKSSRFSGRCVLTALRAAEHGRQKVPMQKLSPSQGIKSQVHAPTFYEPASQVLFYARCRAAAEISDKCALSTDRKRTASAVLFYFLSSLFRFYTFTLFRLFLREKFAGLADIFVDGVFERLDRLKLHLRAQELMQLYVDHLAVQVARKIE